MKKNKYFDWVRMIHSCCWCDVTKHNSGAVQKIETKGTVYTTTVQKIELDQSKCVLQRCVRMCQCIHWLVSCRVCEIKLYKRHNKHCTESLGFDRLRLYWQ